MLKASEVIKKVKITQTPSLNQYFHFAVNLSCFFPPPLWLCVCVCLCVCVVIVKRNLLQYKILFCSSHMIFYFDICLLSLTIIKKSLKLRDYISSYTHMCICICVCVCVCVYIYIYHS